MARQLEPNTTPIPDVILDDWIAKLSGSEFKVVMFIARKTYGWGKSQDGLSVSQIATGTNLGRSTVIAALNALEQNSGPVVCVPSDLPPGHPRAWNSYCLNMEWAEEKESAHTPTRPESKPVQKVNPSRKMTLPVQKLDQLPVQILDPQDTPFQETLLQETTPLPPDGGGGGDTDTEVIIDRPAAKWPWLKSIPAEESALADFYEKTFYPAYPRSESPQAGWKAFKKLCREWSPGLADALMESLTEYAKCPQWQDRTKVPHPATWINQRRWEGKPVLQPPNGGQGQGQFRQPESTQSRYREYKD